MDLLDHAASCRHCASALREAIALFAPDDPQKIAECLPPHKTRRWTLRSPRILIPAIAALCIVIVATAMKLRQDPLPTLLAEAYAQNRPFEFRLPGAAYGPVRTKRSAQGSALQKPASLLDAEAILSHRQSDPSYRRLAGVADLLESDPANAVESLDRAHRDSPSDLDTAIDLAIARAALAESADRPSGYAVALELLDTAQQKRPNDLVIAFNRALVCERLKLYVEAERQWKKYLELDANSAWADEAKAHLKEVESVIGRRSQLRHALEAGEQAYLDLPPDLRSDPSEYLDIEAIYWLARARQPVTDQALVKLAAELEATLSDRWLEDARREAQNPSDAAALLNLVRLNARGDPDAVINASPAVIHQLANAPALQARARYEYAFALTRATRFQDCLAEAEPLARDLNSSYRWLSLQNRLQLSICLPENGEKGDDLNAMAQVETDAQAAGFANIYTRAFVNREATGRLAGALWPDWPQFLNHLDRTWQSNSSPKVLQLLYFNLGRFAEQADLFHTAFLFTSSAADQYASLGNVTTEALIDESVAAIALEAERPAAAEPYFRRAADLFSAMQGSETAKRYRWEAQLALAQAKLKQGDSVSAAKLLPELDRTEGTIENASVIQFSKELVLGRIALANDDSALASGHLVKAVALARDRVSSQKALPIWRRADSELYSAVQSYIEYLAVARRDPDSAIKAWINMTSGDVWPHARSEAWLVLLVLRGRIAAWLVDGEAIEFHWLKINPEQARALASQQFDLLQSPGTDLAQVHNLSLQLFDELLAPFASRLSHEHTLKAFVGDELNGLALDLALSAGPAVIRDLPVVICRRFDNNESQLRIDPTENALIVAVGNPTQTSRHLPVLEDAEPEAHDVAAAFSTPTVLSGPTAVFQRVSLASSQAEIFHFVGHAYGGASPGAILLNDSELPAAAIMRMDWHQARLVVLSACLTGDIDIGGPPGPDGLVSAFLVAGARAVVASRWSVDSAATRQLMIAFYRQLRSGADLSAALARARSSLRADSRYLHPYYWAGFQVYE